MFFNLKQSKVKSKYFEDKFLNYLCSSKAALTLFLVMIRGNDLPKTSSISSTPIAMTSASSSTMMVSLLKLFFFSIAYSSQNCPDTNFPHSIPSTHLFKTPDLTMYMDEASSPSLQILLFFVNFCLIAMEAILSFWQEVKYTKISEDVTEEVIFIDKGSCFCEVFLYGRTDCFSKGASINKPQEGWFGCLDGGRSRWGVEKG